MKVLVTGGNNSVGRGVINYLKDRGHEVVLFDTKQDAVQDVRFIQGDILDIFDVKLAVKGMDAVVHLGGTSISVSDPTYKVLSLHSTGVFNLFDAASNAGIPRFIYAASGSSYGIVYGDPNPRYLPIDEEHPITPRDPYTLCKLIGEETCKFYSHKGMQVVSLRPSYVWTEVNSNQLMQMVNDPGMWAGNLWAYVHVEDFAQAVDLALTLEFVNSFEAFLINAPDQGTRLDTRKLLEVYYPCVPVRGPDLTDSDSLICTLKARELMGYNPKHTWQDLE